jgi:hypothetical protein
VTSVHVVVLRRRVLTWAFVVLPEAGERASS